MDISGTVCFDHSFYDDYDVDISVKIYTLFEQHFNHLLWDCDVIETLGKRGMCESDIKIRSHSACLMFQCIQCRKLHCFFISCHISSTKCKKKKPKNELQDVNYTLS